MKICKHLAEVHDQQPKRRVCEDCIKTGDSWVHLRVCLTCGHVACCDSSPNRHATRHHQTTHHPIVQSIEPGEDWGWCYPDQLSLDLSRGVAHATVAD
jgi:hypothetical protein